MKLKKFFHQKLIRDKIPDLIEKENGKFEVKTLGTKKFEIELKRKLLEESKEISKASLKELPNELADALEILKSIAEHYKIPFKNIGKKMIQKRKKRGRFKKKLFLVWSSAKSG
jgi:predicted house-cleaning noncanonical NTP pyrophosphatase (MazG superfamily)